MLPWDVEAGVSIFGRQGYPFAPYRHTALGADSLRVLVVPEIDTYRLDDLWSTDIRFAKRFTLRGNASIQFIADGFNILNANTELVLRVGF